MIFVIAEHHEGTLVRASLEAVAAARAIGDPVTVVAPCAAAGPFLGAVAQANVAEVIALEHQELGVYSPDAYVAALAGFVAASPPSHVVFAHTYQARDYAPRLAARLDRPLVTDCIAVKRSDRDLVFTRPMFQGKVSADVVLEGPPPHLVTFQAGAFRAEAPGPDASPAPIRSIAASIPPGAVRQRPEPPFREARQAVDLTQAERIVSVGRGIKEEQHVALARRLAEALGAELAASRPICDAGWLPMDRQVGSSGQTVAPKLYVALGISGAIQHIVGMKGSRTIVAINKDADAPIFEVADYGIVGDLFEIVPAMIEALK